MHGTARRQGTGRQVALRGRHAHMLHQQFEQAVIAQRCAQQRLVVAGQDPPPGFRLLPRDVGQAVDQRLQQGMLHGTVVVIALQVFAAGGRRQPRGFDHPPMKPAHGGSRSRASSSSSMPRTNTDRLRLSLVP